MRAVRVHLHDRVVVALQRPLETRDVGGAETSLGAAMQHVKPAIASSEGLGEGTGTIRAGIVDHQGVRLRHRQV